MKLKLLFIFHLLGITLICAHARAESNPLSPLTEMRIDELEGLSLEDLLNIFLSRVTTEIPSLSKNRRLAFEAYQLSQTSSLSFSGIP